MEASLVLALLLQNHSDHSKFNSQLCASLLRMAVMERLSQLLHPMLGEEDAEKTWRLGERTTVHCSVHTVLAVVPLQRTALLAV